MTSHIVRIAAGLLAALTAAALLKFAAQLSGLFAHSNSTTVFGGLWSALQTIASYGLLPAILAIGASELLRLRGVAAHLALGFAAIFFAAFLAARGESLTSPVFASGIFSGFALCATALISSTVYWAIAGRRAGWRGDAAEHAELMAVEAFRTASVNADVRYCKECALGWGALGLVAFLLLSWVILGLGGLETSFIAETESQGNAALKQAGYTWARFKVSGGRGFILGEAPDEAQKFAAFNNVREALASVTGFPGIIADVGNLTVAGAAGDKLANQLAEATRRENEAKAEAQAQRMAAAAARAAEADANRRANAQTLMAQPEVSQKQLAMADEGQPVLPGAERAADDQDGVPAAAAPADQENQTPDKAAAGAQRPAQTASIEDTGTSDGQVAPSAEDVGAAPQGIAAVASPEQNCTSQDLAMIESSNIHFEEQRFDIAADYDEQLNRLAASSLACPQQFIVVSGYASTNSDSLFNRSLGLQRAEKVRDSLVARGVPATRVSAKASSAASESSSEEQRAMNRRVDFKLASASELSRDANLGPDERASKCEGDLAGIMAQSIIHFPTASASVSAESMGLIKKLARSIWTCGSVIVTVEGHTDKTGDPVFNQQLSEARANTVREALIAAGADTTRLASRGFASSQPFDPGQNSQAYALNRRIEFKVSGKFTSSNTGGP